MAVGYAGDPAGAIARVEACARSGPLRDSHLPLAVLAHLSAMRGDADAARRFADESERLGGSPREHQSLFAQVERLLDGSRQTA